MALFSDIAKKFNENAVKTTFDKTFDKQKQEQIISQILKRLYAYGIAGNKQKLITDKHAQGEFYAEMTIGIKKEANLPTSRVTLQHTGEFYDSFTSKKIAQGFEIKADFEKKDDHIWRNFTGIFASAEKFENAITSLTENEQKIMLENVKNEIVDNIIKETTK